ncbi:sortase [Candidatus Peregrinibacteria bacterium]|nr:sortase [Candidatus Peregrinibacteria bacterium]MBI3816941.1 sortase [Candidatus Peregrinibacteria bacterium]
MISPLHHPHSAFYDDDGNIIVPRDDQADATPSESQAMRDCSASQSMNAGSEEIIEWDTLAAEQNDPPVPAHEKPVESQLATLRVLTRKTLREGMRQYRESIAATEPFLRELEDEATTGLKRLWLFLTQPVVIPMRKRTKTYNRGTLFLIDVVRFGGTFAGIFLVLFVALNFQSFWDIASARLSLLLSSPSLDLSNAPGTSDLAATLRESRSRLRSAGDLKSLLPDVGPPDTLLMIPKLHLTAPIVNTPTDALLRQDWPGVEKEIQSALEQGVVHYPGTAKFGQMGNPLITGHSSFFLWSPGKFKSIFARLSELNPGDEYWVYANGDKHRYVVRSKREVSPSDVSVLDQPTDERIATLMTCTPVGTTLRRLIVVAQEVDPLSGIALNVGDHSQKQQTVKVKLDSLPI